MKLVVTDSSPLIMLARSELVSMLAKLAGDVIAPAVVFNECTANRERPGAQAILRAREEGHLALRPDPTAAWPGGAPVALGAGELAAIGLAHELGAMVLMDERLGRRIARARGVTVIGSAGVLLAAKECGLLPKVAPILHKWKKWGYFLSPDLMSAVLTRAGENE